MTGKHRHTLALALLLGGATPAFAAPVNYTCEGTASRVTNNAWTGDQRNEWQIAFRMQVNRAAGTVMIFAVQGTRFIRAGRHALAADGQGRVAMSWTIMDQANRSQPVTMAIARDGAFEGAWSESNPSAAAEGVMGGIFGPEAGQMMRVTSRGTFSGVCWQ